MEDVIKRFLTVDASSGSGRGWGEGWGSGSGSGRGSGWGSGRGWGSGEGWGWGSGDDSGEGEGRGEGEGSGWGWGEGWGEGDGSGVSMFCGRPVYMVDGAQTLIDRAHGSVARGSILQSDLQLKPCYIVKGGGFFAHGETIEEARDALEEKIMDNLPVEEKIAEFKKRFQPGKKYAAKDFYDWHHFLTGSCEMGRKQFASDRGIDIETAAFTPEEFMDLTKDAYGGAVIRRLKEAWTQ